MANECDEKTLRNLKAKEVFYQVSREGGREGGREGVERERERKNNQAIVFAFRVGNQRLVILCTISLQGSFGK